MSLIQGETYEESSSAEVGYVGDEDPKPKRPVNKKIVGIALIAIAVLAFIVIVFTAVSRGGDSAEDDLVIPEDDFFVEEFEPVVTFSYTSDEIEALRACGYTGSEIEQFEFDAISASAKIAEAEALIEQKQKEFLEKLSDTASPEYQELLAMTWVGGDSFTLTSLPEDSEKWEHNNVTLNADYVKVPTQGNQLWIRIELEDGTYAFMETTPDRYVKLKDSGNIVVTFARITYNGVTVISNIKEVITGG